MPSHRQAPLSQSKRERFRQQVLALHGPVCRMPVCKMATRAIDLTLKAPHPASYTADHVVEVCMGGSPYDPANGRPAHWRCNSSAGTSNLNRRRKRGYAKQRGGIRTLRTSQDW